MTREEAIDLIYRRSQHCQETAEAFDVLKEKPCEDCISRQAVLDAIDAAAWAFCDYLICNGRYDEQKPISLFVDKLREYVREELPPVTPQEPCEDAISRQAVLEMAFDMSEIDGEHFTYPYMVVDVEGIQKLPSVNPQRTGHWIRDTITDIYHCSECRSICHQDPKSKDDYCRYCGARMVETQERSGE